MLQPALRPGPKLTDTPTVVEAPSADVREGAKLQWWRKTTMRMSLAELEAATGYSRQVIGAYEKGHTIQGKRIGSRAWLRFRLACAGAERNHASRTPFNWGVDP